MMTAIDGKEALDCKFDKKKEISTNHRAISEEMN